MSKLQDKMALKYQSVSEKENRDELLQHLKNSPIPDDQLLANLGLFLESKHLSRILFMDFLFRQIVDVQGVIMELGTRWGQNLALFSALRGIYDPFNRHRRIVGFDTFSGFPAIAREDAGSEMMQPGELSVPEGYENTLTNILKCHENANPLSHIEKFEIRKGDAALEIQRFLKQAPQTIVALAYFDFDLYGPTKKCLEALRPHLTKGSVLAFDELNDPDSPGETVALKEVFGLNHVRLKRFPHVSRASYFILD